MTSCHCHWRTVFTSLGESWTCGRVRRPDRRVRRCRSARRGFIAGESAASNSVGERAW
uniref:Uncharacterized protein n=1 Tax=Arundo donax TaxID=35708 RepID=A0A0A9C7N7_ARUDO